VHAQPVVFGSVVVAYYDRFVHSDRNASRRCATADMACVSGDFDLYQRTCLAVQHLAGHDGRDPHQGPPRIRRLVLEHRDADCYEVANRSDCG
jgi:hypothetical protein